MEPVALLRQYRVGRYPAQDQYVLLSTRSLSPGIPVWRRFCKVKEEKGDVVFLTKEFFRLVLINPKRR